MRLTVLPLLLLLLLASTAQAELKGTFSVPGQATMTIHYKDNDHIRLDTPSQGFMLISPEGMYTVLSQGGMRIAFDMSGMGDMLKQFDTKALDDFADGEPPTITATDRKETVAGFTGRVHTVTMGDLTSEVVLTDDEDVVALTEGFLAAITRLGQSISPHSGLDIEAMLHIIRDTGYPGILKQDQGVVLRSLETVEMGDAFYKLPENIQVMNMGGR
ncbi:MAG: hypothetical protein EA349_16720 [Halomonadaceae bacterium]|nr:MAG: hypothetical protein EA349_16720 [Halomonadaceae bacterium]